MCETTQASQHTSKVETAEVKFGRGLHGAGVAREREAVVVVEIDAAAVRLQPANR